MATLPALFYAACRCDRRAIMVGDPRQLPPIVQSDDELVRRAIGRNVFDVTVPDPERSDVVAMLDVQYRMHPAIGALVGRLFYGGRLVARRRPRDRGDRGARAVPGPARSSSSTRASSVRALARRAARAINPASAEAHRRPRARGRARRRDVGRRDHAVRRAGRRDPPPARGARHRATPSSAARSIASRAASATS